MHHPATELPRGIGHAIRRSTQQHLAIIESTTIVCMVVEPSSATRTAQQPPYTGDGCPRTFLCFERRHAWPGAHHATSHPHRRRFCMPGPRYWQQQVDYTIAATLSPSPGPTMRSSSAPASASRNPRRGRRTDRRIRWLTRSCHRAQGATCARRPNASASLLHAGSFAPRRSSEIDGGTGDFPQFM